MVRASVFAFVLIAPSGSSIGPDFAMDGPEDLEAAVDLSHGSRRSFNFSNSLPSKLVAGALVSEPLAAGVEAVFSSASPMSCAVGQSLATWSVDTPGLIAFESYK